MTDGFLGVSWFVWAGLAAVLAAMFTVFQIPKQTSQTTGLTHIGSILAPFEQIADCSDVMIVPT